jgi:hypothetical protein
VLRVAEVDEGVEVLDRLEDHVAAAAAIAAVGAAELDVFFAPEGDDTVAAIAGPAVDFRLVEEFHGVLKTKRGPAVPTPIASW